MVQVGYLDFGFLQPNNSLIIGLVFENLNNRYKIFVFTFQHFASCSAAACLQELVIIAIVSTEIIFG